MSDSNLPNDGSFSGRFHHVQAGVVGTIRYSSSINGYTIDSSVVGDSTGRFGLLDIVSLLLMRNW